MNRIVGVMKMHSRDRWTAYIVPGIVLFSSFIVNLIIASVLTEPLYTGGLSSIYVFVLVAGITALTNTFPYALGMSIRRMDYFWGTTAMAVVSSAITGLLLWTLSIVENALDGWATNLYFFHVPYLTDGNLAEQMLVFFMPLLHMYAMGFIIASIYRRFGRNGMYVFFLALFLIFSLGGFVLTYYGLWVDAFGWMANLTAFEYALWLIPLTALFFVLSYALLRKATV